MSFKRCTICASTVVKLCSHVTLGDPINPTEALVVTQGIGLPVGTVGTLATVLKNVIQETLGISCQCVYSFLVHFIIALVQRFPTSLVV